MTREIGEVLVRHLGLIGELSAEDEEALLSVRGQIRDLQRGEDVLTDGERPAHSVVVIDGLLQRYTVGPQGKRQIHSFYIPTDTPSLEAVHIGVMDNNLGALTPTRVGLVPLPELHRMMGLRPNVLSLIWRETLVQAAILRAARYRTFLNVCRGHPLCGCLSRLRIQSRCARDHGEGTT